MDRKRKFDDILNECLERILLKGETIEQCLQSYPEYASELEPLLQTSTFAKQTMAVKPRPEFKEKARSQFQLAVREKVRKAHKENQPVHSLFRQPRYALVVAMVLAILLTGGGVVTAASYSMPDSPLYQVKVVTEEAQLALPHSDISKATIYAKLSDKRVTEIVVMAEEGKTEQVERVVSRLNEHLVALAAVTGAEKNESAQLVDSPAQQPSLENDTKAPAPAQAPITAATPPTVSPTTEATQPRKPVGTDKEDSRAIKLDKKAKLKEILAEQAEKHQQALQEAMEKAPESVKEKLRQTINLSEDSYEKALESLD